MTQVSWSEQLFSSLIPTLVASLVAGSSFETAEMTPGLEATIVNAISNWNKIIVLMLIIAVLKQKFEKRIKW